MSIRNYNAWLKAARKAARKTGGLSLPAARKAYKKMAARVGRPLKGTDVQKHPRIFKDSLPKKKRSAGLDRKSSQVRNTSNSKRANAGSSAKSARASQVPRRAAQPVQRSRKGSSRAQGEAGRLSDDRARQALGERNASEVEYVSTPNYTKGGAKGVFNLQLQIHITGPAGQTKKQLDAIAENWLQGKGVPNGFKAWKLEWNNKETRDPRTMRVARSHFKHIPFNF